MNSYKFFIYTGIRKSTHVNIMVLVKCLCPCFTVFVILFFIVVHRLFRILKQKDFNLAETVTPSPLSTRSHPKTSNNMEINEIRHIVELRVSMIRRHLTTL